MARLLAIASANLDLTARVPRLPRAGETLIAESGTACPGGKGLNQAIAAKRLGAEVGLVACVGDDAAGDMVRAAVEAEGIEIVGWHIVPDQPTGSALIHVTPDGENAIVVVSGANAELTADHIDAVFADDAKWDGVLATLESPPQAVLRLTHHCDTAACPLQIDAGGGLDHLASLDLSGVDVLTLNTTELAAAIGEADPHYEVGAPQAEMLWTKRMGDAAMVLLKCGSEGSVLWTPKGPVNAPAFEIEAIDTVGAGDAHSAAFAVACAENMPMGDALAFANAAGALACLGHGASRSMPTREDVERALSR